MTLPWFLNPWTEVRRLRGELKWRDHMRLDMAQAWRDERRASRKYSRSGNMRSAFKRGAWKWVESQPVEF